jgi:hypothetical protein
MSAAYSWTSAKSVNKKGRKINRSVKIRNGSTLSYIILSRLTLSSVAAPNQIAMHQFDGLHSSEARRILADNCNDLLGGYPSQSMQFGISDEWSAEHFAVEAVTGPL